MNGSALHTSKVALQVSPTLRKDRPDLGRMKTSASLIQFDDMSKMLIPAKQTRVVRLLAARIIAAEARLAVPFDIRNWLQSPPLMTRPSRRWCNANIPMRSNLR